MPDDGFYLSILNNARILGELERGAGNTIMLREEFSEIPSMSGLDYETVQDAYRVYRNAYNTPAVKTDALEDILNSI